MQKMGTRGRCHEQINNVKVPGTDHGLGHGTTAAKNSTTASTEFPLAACGRPKAFLGLSNHSEGALYLNNACS
jgi:hypothetical protein